MLPNKCEKTRLLLHFFGQHFLKGGIIYLFITLNICSYYQMHSNILKNIYLKLASINKGSVDLTTILSTQTSLENLYTYTQL